MDTQITADSPISNVTSGHAGQAPDLDIADDCFTHETLDVLVRARAMISDPNHWCRHSYGRTFFGLPVSEHSFWAVRWCATGAIRRAARGIELDAAVPRIKFGIESRLLKCKLENYNDKHTHAEVLAMFDRRIAELEKA